MLHKVFEKNKGKSSYVAYITPKNCFHNKIALNQRNNRL